MSFFVSFLCFCFYLLLPSRSYKQRGEVRDVPFNARCLIIKLRVVGSWCTAVALCLEDSLCVSLLSRITQRFNCLCVSEFIKNRLLI